MWYRSAKILLEPFIADLTSKENVCIYGVLEVFDKRFSQEFSRFSEDGCVVCFAWRSLPMAKKPAQDGVRSVRKRARRGTGRSRKEAKVEIPEPTVDPDFDIGGGKFYLSWFLKPARRYARKDGAPHKGSAHPEWTDSDIVLDGILLTLKKAERKQNTGVENPFEGVGRDPEAYRRAVARNMVRSAARRYFAQGREETRPRDTVESQSMTVREDARLDGLWGLFPQEAFVNALEEFFGVPLFKVDSKIKRGA
jgi:hypothetical protein